MEPLFQTYTKNTKAHLIELVKGMRSTALTVVMYVLCAGILGGAVFNYYFKDVTSAVLFGLMGLLFLAWYIVTPYYVANTNHKRQNTALGGDAETETSFYEDRFVTITLQSKSELSLQYAQIRRVIKTRSLYLIVLPQQLVVSLDQKGFTTGSPEGLEAFLKEKAPKAKYRL